jgi:glycosyltransferase involved in cell wall biosynthesis
VKDGPLDIAVAVHGRFHAFDLAIGLLQIGHNVTVYTNYPARVASRFGLSPEHVRGYPPHGLAARAAYRVAAGDADALLNPWFGRWAAQQMRKKAWDIVHIWSGVATEWLEQPHAPSVCALARGSAHIRTQRNLLDEEEQRTGARLDKPSDWTVEREEFEYARSNKIVVPSQFALQSFTDRGIPRERVRLVPLAAGIDRFRADHTAIETRLTRIERKEPLRVLFVGAISYQKGMHDLLQIMESVPAGHMEFRLVGPLTRECRPIRDRLAARAQLIGKVDEAELPAHYAWADLFVLPSIQDGFAVVLAQA